jgi:peptidoglycan/xylan/chitin deacetylase (PgdA/CDA1 family)
LISRSLIFALSLVPTLGLAAPVADVVVDNSDAAHFTCWNSDQGQVMVLLWHGLDEAFGYNPDDFRAQIQYLADNGYSSITLDQLLSWIQTGLPVLPPKPLVLTFDDNYITIYTVAFPALQSHGFTGVNFAHTDYVGVPPGGPPPTGNDHADWTEINEMESAGVIFTESHTRTHRDLTTLTTAVVSDELVNSKAAIEAHIPGKTCRHFAYPYGAFNASVISAVQAAGYLTAVSTVGGPVTRSTDLMTINRNGVTPSTAISTLAGLVSNATRGSEWAHSTSAPGYLGADYQFASAGVGQAVARWDFTLSQAGRWEVLVRYTSEANRATNAPFTVSHEGGETTVPLDETTGGGSWVSLGEFTFSDATPYTVELTNDADGVVIADGIRLAYLGPTVPAGIVIFGTN